MYNSDIDIIELQSYHNEQLYNSLLSETPDYRQIQQAHQQILLLKKKQEKKKKEQADFMLWALSMLERLVNQAFVPKVNKAIDEVLNKLNPLRF